MDEFLTTKQFANLHGVSQRTVQRWIAEGQIFAVKIGRRNLISSDEPSPQEYGTLPEPVIAEPEPLPETPFEPTPDELAPEDEEPFIDDEETDICGGGTPAGVEILWASNQPPTDLRKSFSTYEEAVDYADEIPVTTTVFRRAEDCFYQVRIDY